MRPRILFIVQLPPPIHGVTVMNQHTIDSPGWKTGYDVKTLPLHFGQTLNDIGKITPRKLLHMVGFIFKLLGTLVRFRPSLVYFTIVPIGKVFYRDALFTALIKLFCKRVVFHLHREGIAVMAQSGRFKRWLLRKTFKGVATICLSDRLTEDIRPIYDPQPYVLYNGIEIINKRVIERNNEAPVILYLSNLVIAKGIEVFLQSLASLHRQGYPFKARIVGGSVDYTIEQAREFCKAVGIAHLVDVTGPKFGADKIDELTNADIFVLPSFTECVPLSILEAMQFDLPVVATCVGGIPDMLQHGITGLLIPPGSSKELTNKLQLLLNDPAARKRMGASARECFMQRFTIASYYEGLQEIVDQVLQGKMHR